MLKSMLVGVFAVALVCWGIGAYNRMVRLRAKTIQTFAAVHSLRLQLDKVLEGSEHPEQSIADRLKIKAAYELENGVYGHAVTQYNEAIVQIPAAWLAALFGFKPINKEINEH